MNHTYQYKSDKVQAVKWTGENYEEIKEFLGDIQVNKGDHNLKILHNGFSYVSGHEWVIRHEDGEITTDHNSHFVRNFEKVPDVKPERRRFIEALNKIKCIKDQVNHDIDDQGYSAKDTLQVIFENIDHVLEEFDIDLDELMNEI